MIRRFIPLVIALTLVATAATADEDHVARELLLTQGCKGCHFFGGNGGTFGPSLDKVGKRLNAGQIERKLVTPKADKPDSIMPDYSHLSDDELKALADYLAGQK